MYTHTHAHTKVSIYKSIVVGDEIFIYRHITRVIILLLHAVAVAAAISSDDRAFRSNGTRSRYYTVKTFGLAGRTRRKLFRRSSISLPFPGSFVRRAQHHVDIRHAHGRIREPHDCAVRTSRYVEALGAIRMRTRVLQMQQDTCARVECGNVI